MESIRNVCILAHVDHGKTSIADNLLYTNGIISTYSAGDLRHLDSTQDEQERGITMKSSCISLKYLHQNKLKENSEPKNYIVNLIDSPGHVDFSGEVSTAVKISDNAFIVVDVVEGVSSQTRTVIKQAWKERLNFILVLNKIDRMCLELKMDTTSAYNKLEEVIRDVHHIIGEMISLDNREEEEKTDSIITPEEISRNYDTTPFSPLKSTVVFCSAFHQWGFRISDFLLKYSQSLGIDKIELYKKMWGDYYINSKRKICKGAQSEDRKNIFTSLILDPIWSVYKSLEMKEFDEVVRMMSKLDIKVELKRSNRDSSVIDNIRNVFRKWMPLPTVLFDALIERCPNPRAAMTDKKVSLLVPNEKFVKAKEIIKNASTDKTAPTVVFISKFMFQSNSNTDLIGLGRVYSGQVRPGLKVFAFSPEFDPQLVSSEFLSSTPDDFPDGPINVYESSEKIKDVAFVTSLSGVHQFMGHEQIFLPNGAHAGFVVGLTGFSCHEAIRNLTVTANCTLSDSLGLFSFRSGSNASSNSSVDDITNIICVSVEPKKVIYLNELQDALQLLEKADSMARVSLAPTGELLIHAAGEIHLQKCLNELTTRIAPHIELDVSAPIVPFRETVTHRAFRNANLVEDIRSLSEELKILEQSCVLKPTETEDNFRMDNCLNQQGVTDSIVVFIRPPQKTGMKFCCRISVHSLPDALIDWIDSGANLKSLKTVLDLASEQEQTICSGTDIVPIDYRSLSDKLWTTGGKTTQGNLLFSYIGRAGLCVSDSNTQIDPYSHSILKGFHRTLLAGPICQEQLKNIVFILHDVWEEFGQNTEVTTTTDKPVLNPSDTDDDHHFSDLSCNPGQLSSLITKACQVGVMLHPGARLMIAMYKLDLEVRINTYKNLSSLINQLHGQIISQEVNFGNFVVEARLPVIESFGFGDKLRKKTSGEVGLPQLKTVCWELLNCPPFLDLNLYKIIADRAENCDIGISQELIMRTQKYINNVRQRKGIQVRQQLIESGTKQRTLNKKK